jgi:tetratricopeptide (TPR) repeat protein
MPYADPGSCFEAAARHLFRHLNDVSALRSNPLVRSFFARAKKDQGHAALLPEIHARILMEAAALCSESAAGLEARARRQHAIVAALCAGESPLETAARLGVSMAHYYRERHVVCTGVSRALMEPALKCATRFDVGDRLKLLFARTAALLDQGFAHKAVSLLEEARASAPEGAASSALRLEIARVTASVGLATGVEELLTESGLASLRRDEHRTSGWLGDHQALTAALLAMEIGRDANAGRGLEVLAKRRITDRHADETSLDAFIRCGSWYCDSGRFSEARNMLRHAREVYHRLPHVPARLQIAIALLASKCAEDSADGFDLEHRWLNEALALSISNGSTHGVLAAMSGLMFYYGSVGRDDEVYTLAEEGLRIAQTTEGSRPLEAIGVQSVVILLRTRYWRSVAPLIFEVEELALPRSFNWGVLKQAQGVYLTRTGRYDQAQTSLAKAYDVAKTLNNRKFEGVVLRELAVAKHQVGALSESVECIRQAVELAEEHCSAYTLWITYDTASRLLRDCRIARLAKQAAAAVSARADVLQNVADQGRHDGLPLTWASRAHFSRTVRPRLTISTGSEGRASHARAHLG